MPTISSSTPMAMATGMVRDRAPAPASTRMRKISSVAYAEDDNASDEKTASAFVLERRSWASWALASGRPTRNQRSLAHSLLSAPRGAKTLSRATSVSDDASRNVSWNGRWMRTYRSPGLWPWRSSRMWTVGIALPYGTLSLLPSDTAGSPVTPGGTAAACPLAGVLSPAALVVGVGGGVE